MKLLTFLAMIALSTPQTTIATNVLNPLPTPSEPCKTVTTPQGDMCITQALRVYGTIRTQYETDAKRICHGWAGNGYQVWETAPREWLCVK